MGCLIYQDFNDCGMASGDNFLFILESDIPSIDIGEWIRWMLKPNGDFDIHLFYNKLRGSSSIVFP